MYGTPTPSYPRTAYLLTLVGGVLIAVISALSGLALWALQGSETVLGMQVQLTPTEEGTLAVAIMIGAVIAYAATVMKSRPAAARAWGIPVIVLAIVTLFLAGGGLFIGAILAIVGGAIAARWKFPAVPAPALPTFAGPGYGTPPGGTGTPTPPLGGPGKYCIHCGAANPAIARFCAKCGAGFGP